MHKLTKALTSVVLGGVCALSFTMTACAPEEPETEPHEHTYSDAWVYNDTQHWHPASCDDTNTVSEQAAHVDENGDLKCDVCGYNYPHEHVFDMDKWTSDETNHWHAALCGHDAKNGEAAHTPDVTGVCTVCGYKVGRRLKLRSFRNRLPSTPKALLNITTRLTAGRARTPPRTTSTKTTPIPTTTAATA